MLTNPAALGVLPIGAVAPYVAPAAGAGERCLFLSPCESDAATLTASSEAGTLGVANVQNPEPTKVWRSAGLEESISGTLRRPLACNTLALIWPTPSSDAVMRMRMATTAELLTTAPDVADTGWQSAWPATGKPCVDAWPNYLSLLRWTPNGAGLYWRLDVADPGNADGHIDIGRLMLGVAWQPTYNLDLDPSIGFVPLDVQAPNPYGQTFTDPRPYAQRQFDISFAGGNQDDVHDFAMELSRLRGQAGDIVFCMDPAEGSRFHNWSLQALFAGRAVYKAQPLWDGSKQVWGFTLSLIEKL